MSIRVTHHLHTAQKDYPIYVGSHLGQDIAQFIKEKIPNAVRVCVISDSTVSALWAQKFEDALRASADGSYELSRISFPAGEEHKNIQMLSYLLEELAAHELTRSDCVIALGGGVTGDIAGLASALYLRGVKLIHVPTTLLSMVDSSIGGKTANDLHAGKNLAGSFTQPEAVFVDVDFLSTLSPEQFRDSCGEIIKYGVIQDAQLFHTLRTKNLCELAHAADNAAGAADNADCLIHTIARCVEIKAGVVSQDEHETGLRQTLNFGHTLGHAIEAALHFEQGHGTCVAQGMCMIARAAARLGICEENVYEEIRDCVSAYGLPTSTDIDAKTLYTYAIHDKKRRGDHINVVFPVHIGEVVIQSLRLDEFMQMIRLTRP